VYRWGPDDYLAGVDEVAAEQSRGFGRARRLDTVVDVQRVLLLGRRDGV